MLGKDEKPTDEEWFEEMDERFLTLKHQVHKIQRWNMQTHLDSLLRRIANHAAQEAPGGQKQAAVVVILADHQRGELWKRKPISG